jgi:hypothetical protein
MPNDYIEKYLKMTNKEKEKLLFKTIKEVFKSKEWKFNSYFVFKSVNDFFFDCTFSFNPKENKIWVKLGFKPMIFDDIFWDITEMPENKKMPLSFRSNAAFNISSFQILEYNLILKDTDNPFKEISQTLQTIDSKVYETIKSIKNTNEYLDCISKVDRPNYNSIITGHIYNKNYDLAKQKIAFCRLEKISSGYVFGKDDFYDLAEKYIAKTNKKQRAKFNWKSLFWEK